ncbi:hypothetical protein LTR37_007866 [Vermiconidia calcicola]|uniref:Uncharacterized protein n=1 Tax=Vermiconidia calcicola TaxID=1690605 RepID=A0ACC3NCH4_9PEZI|nr:hypothetical protein LTR37_007866 [Vermiconidia calcicola]
MAVPTHCGHCGANASRACVQCRSIKYCTKECQEADWRTHTLVCKWYAGLAQRPGPSWRRAILIPAQNVNPHFIWIDTFSSGESDQSSASTSVEEGDADVRECAGLVNGVKLSDDTESEDSFDEFYGVPDVDSKEKNAIPKFDYLLGHDDPSQGDAKLVLGNMGGGQHLNHSIYVRFRDSFLLDGSETNSSLEYLSRGRTNSRWRGPMIVYAMSKVSDPGACYDLTPSDLTIAIEGIVQYTNQVYNLMEYWREEPMPRKIKGVRVNAKQPFYEEVEVPVQHSVFFRKIPQLCDRIGLPLRTYSRSSSSTAGQANPDNKPAVPAAYLRINLDTTGSDQSDTDAAFGLVPQQWLESTSSVLIIRANKTALNAKVVEAACSFAKKIVLPLVTNVRSGTDRDELLSRITKEKWLQFLADPKQATEDPEDL